MNSKVIIGIDLGGTNLKIALLDLNCRIRYKEFLSTQRFKNQESLVSGILDSIGRIIESQNLKKNNILGIGLGLPGPIDEELGIVHFLPNIAGWKEVRLRSILERKSGLRVFLDNDAKLMSLAESRFGAARGFKNALCLTLGEYDSMVPPNQRRRGAVLSELETGFGGMGFFINPYVEALHNRLSGMTRYGLLQERKKLLAETVQEIADRSGIAVDMESLEGRLMSAAESSDWGVCYMHHRVTNKMGTCS